VRAGRRRVARNRIATPLLTVAPTSLLFGCALLRLTAHSLEAGSPGKYRAGSGVRDVICLTIGRCGRAWKGDRKRKEDADNCTTARYKARWKSRYEVRRQQEREMGA